eukprot:SAG11_NODE_14536_length_608_cov_3.263261_1_plen_27_part_10
MCFQAGVALHMRAPSAMSARVRGVSGG